MASTPPCNNCQKASGLSAPPGKRHPKPMTAIGSVSRRSYRLSRVCRSKASRDTCLGDNFWILVRKSFTRQFLRSFTKYLVDFLVRKVLDGIQRIAIENLQWGMGRLGNWLGPLCTECQLA